MLRKRILSAFQWCISSFHISWAKKSYNPKREEGFFSCVGVISYIKNILLNAPCLYSGNNSSPVSFFTLWIITFLLKRYEMTRYIIGKLIKLPFKTCILSSYIIFFPQILKCYRTTWESTDIRYSLTGVISQLFLYEILIKS